MDKLFRLHWFAGKAEDIWGENVQDAFYRAGIGNGAMAALDYWEEVKQLPFDQKIIIIDGVAPSNPFFIDAIKKFLSNKPKSGEVASINYGRFEFKYKYQGYSRYNYKFKDVTPDLG